jgi:DNA-binding NarL/FixJ family response regulator
MKARVFIVDDHYMVVEGIRSLLQHDANIEWAGHAMNASSCLAFLQQDQPDIILMDISLPDMSGVDLCKAVRAQWPSVFVLGLSTFNQQSLIRQMMEHGASGYLLKNATKEEMLEGIQTVVRGGTFLSEEAARAMHSSPAEGRPLITSREREVLELIAEGLTNPQIAGRLFVSVTTVETHRKNLLAKFLAKNTAELVRLGIYFQCISADKGLK